ncbi:MAG: hypothetical protein H6561_11095 [Lewinellaceae bacterium]|nr:hypothetical protein [Lewinellaceae bacterium]
MQLQRLIIKSLWLQPGSGGAGDTYDANGNLKTDTYKGITNITYNYLNLPSAIEWGTTKRSNLPTMRRVPY